MPEENSDVALGRILERIDNLKDTVGGLRQEVSESKTMLTLWTEKMSELGHEIRIRALREDVDAINLWKNGFWTRTLAASAAVTAVIGSMIAWMRR